MNARPPDRVSLLWCPVCGRDDRYTFLRQARLHNRPDGRRCSGKVEELEYVIPRAPEPLPALGVGDIRAAVAVEVAIRPALPHLSDGPLSFVGRTVQYRADTVEQLAELAGLILRDIASGLPDSIAAHPRPEPDAWVPRGAAPPPAGWVY